MNVFTALALTVVILAITTGLQTYLIHRLDNRIAALEAKAEETE